MTTCHLGEHKRIEVTCLDCIERLREEIASLKESLHDVLEISEVEGAINLTVEESCKVQGARILLGPESRFRQ